MTNFRTTNKKQLAARVLCGLLLSTYLTGAYSLPVAWGADNEGTAKVSGSGNVFGTAVINVSAWGSNTKAERNNATAFGFQAWATGDDSTAFGIGTEARGLASTAFGSEANAFGDYSTAFGASTTANGEGSTAFGMRTEAVGDYSTAFGYVGTKKSGYDAPSIKAAEIGTTAYGYATLGGAISAEGGGATAFGSATMGGKISAGTGGGANDKEGATAFGRAYGEKGQILATEMGATAFGSASDGSIKAEEWGATAFGRTNEGGSISASGRGATASGYAEEGGSISAEAEGATAFGYASGGGSKITASGKGATAFGEGTTAKGEGATAFGSGTVAEGEYATAFGSGTTASNNYSTAWGNGTKATESASTAFGAFTEAGGVWSTAFGNGSIAGGLASTAFGSGTAAKGEYATAFGRETEASGSGATAWGGYHDGSNYVKGGTASGLASTAFGIKTEASGVASTAWSHKSVAGGDYSTAFGDSSQAMAENSLAALGGVVDTGADNSAAVGKGAKVTVADAVALGSGSVAFRTAGATDAYRKTDSDTGSAWISTANDIAVGYIDSSDDTKSITRQITGVAAGSKDTDAVNVAQLKKVAEGAVYTAGKGVSIADNEISVKADTKDFAFDSSGTLTLKKDGKVESGNTGVVTGGTVYEALQSQSAAIDGKANKSLDNITDSGKTVVRDLAKEAVKVVDGTNTTVTDGTDGNAKTYAVNVVTNGTIASGDTGIVTGGTVFTETRVSADGNYIKAADSTADNLTALDTQVKKNEDAIGTTADGNYVKASNSVGENLGALDAEIAALAGGAGAGIDELSHRISNVDSKVEKVGAGAAALAALHPMDTDGKFSAAAGFGNYRSANAMALGLFYRPNDQVLFSMGGSMGNGENLLNVGVSFALDKGVPTSKAAMARKIVSLTEENAQQAAKIETLEARLAALEAKLGK